MNRMIFPLTDLIHDLLESVFEFTPVLVPATTAPIPGSSPVFPEGFRSFVRHHGSAAPGPRRSPFSRRLGPPISTGLFLVRRQSTWMTRSISLLRPMTGSSLSSVAAGGQSGPGRPGWGYWHCCRRSLSLETASVPAERHSQHLLAGLVQADPRLFSTRAATPSPSRINPTGYARFADISVAELAGFIHRQLDHFFGPGV